MNATANLDKAVKAVCPIFGVSVVDINDRLTWIVHFREEATTSQRDAALSVVATFDPAVPTTTDLRFAADETERQACKIDSAIMALVNQTKAEWLSCASNNFPSLTAAERTRLGNLFWVVAIGVRQRVRNG